MRGKIERLLLLSLLVVLLVACQSERSPQIPAKVIRVVVPTSSPVTRSEPAAFSRTPEQTFALSETALDEVGLLWRECDMSQDGYWDWKQAEACLGHPPPALSDADKDEFGVRTEQGLRLTVGDDTYETQAHGQAFLRWSTLYKNGHRLTSVFDWSDFRPPDISLQNVGGKIAWEFYGEHQQTIFYDGQDVRSLYDLDAAYRPYEIADKLIFVGRKGDKYFVVYDGQKIGPDFYQITIAYCCETVLYSLRFGQGRYSFWGGRGNERYVVEITAE